MFYVQNWDRNYPAQSAYQILQGQLVNIKKSIQHHDSVGEVKKDSYLQVELSKIQKLVAIIKDHSLTLAANPNDQEAIQFLFDGNVSDKPFLEKGMLVFEQLEKAVNKRLDNLQNSYQKAESNVKDPKFKKLLSQLLAAETGDETIYGSRCDVTALKVIQAFSKNIHFDENEEINELKQLEQLKKGDIQVLNNFKSGAESLRQEILKDFKSGERKLYFCVLDNQHFKNIGGWKHPAYEGHAFVIEETKNEGFRIYQSYTNQYSLKSFLTREMEGNPEGERTFKEFYSFLRNLILLSNATTWDSETNEAYKACFHVDHKAFLGEKIAEDFFNLKYVSMNISDSPNKKSKAKEMIVNAGKSVYEELKTSAKSVGVGATVGTAVSAGAYISYYALSNFFNIFI